MTEHNKHNSVKRLCTHSLESKAIELIVKY